MKTLFAPDSILLMRDDGELPLSETCLVEQDDKNIKKIKRVNLIFINNKIKTLPIKS